LVEVVQDLRWKGEAAARFSRRWASEEVQGMRSMLGERWRSQATAIGVLWRAAAASSRMWDWSGVKPPGGEGG
jgi:hypothetical protein